MVTHGFLVFRYKGLFYSFYNHSDSYPSGLGEEIVQCLNNMSDHEFAEMRDLLKNMPEPIEDGSKKESVWDVMGVLRSPESTEYYITADQCHESNYTYIIDLDLEQFIAKTFSHRISRDIYQIFDLYDIPSNWVELFEHYVENVQF
jgi:hypothetical protein